MAEEILSDAVESVPLEKVPGSTSVFPEAVDQRIESHESVPDHADLKYEKILSKVVSPSSPSVSDDDAVVDAKSLNDMTDEEGKVQKLLDLAQMKGVEHAVRVARSLGDYYVLDRMHDELAEKFYDGLVEKGLIGGE
jgi:hypothetical protein